MSRLAIYVDRTGKQPPAPESLQIESADAVKLAKFFAALGFTVEKQATPEGRQYVLAKATSIELSIFPSRTPQPADDFSMTLMVDDVAAAAARAEAAGGTIASPIKPIPGGKKCVVASPEGLRVVLAEKSGAKPAAAPKPVAKPIAAEPAEPPDFLEAAMAAESGSVDDYDPLANHDPLANYAAPAPMNGRLGAPSPLGSAPTPEMYQFLKAVKLCCAIMLAAIVIPIVVGLFLKFMERSERDEELTALVNGYLSVASVLATLIAQITVVSKCKNVMDSTLLVIAIVADVVGMLAGGITIFVPSLVVVTGMLYLLCVFASPILFGLFLSKTAEAIPNPKLASFSRITVIGLALFIMVLILSLVLGFLSGGDRSTVSNMMLICLITGIVAGLSYVALLGAFATIAIAKPAAPKLNLPQGRR